MAESKKHHFVAQSILSRFTNVSTEGRLYVYDKARDASHPSTVLDAGMENHFNVVHVNGERINFEGGFEQTSSAIQDSPRTVAAHYGRHSPQDKAALAAKILNAVWAG